MMSFYGMSKPSEFLRAMVDGLTHLYPDQAVMMATFGRRIDGVCFGCAATYALQNLLGRQLTLDEFKQAGTWEYVVNGDLDGEDTRSVGEFESVMNMARLGRLLPLADFCELEDRSALYQWVDRWELRDFYGETAPTWRDQLDTVREAIKEMQEVGL